MKVLLVYPRWTFHYGIAGHFARKGSIYPPLNLAYLAAVSGMAGHAVRIVDGEAARLDTPRLLEEAAAFGPEIIGLTATTPFFHTAVSAARALKERFPRVPLVLGGAHLTVLKERAFLPDFDFGFVGEAEESWPVFLRRLEGGEPLAEVPGLLRREGGRVVGSPAPPPIRAVDDLPWPARHLLDPSSYQIGTPRGRRRFTTIMTTRGCPFRCIFCSTEVFGRRVRARAPEGVVAEMVDSVRRFGVEHFIILDDTLTLDRARVLAVCDRIRDAGLRITLEGSTRADLVDEELIARLKEAGLVRLSFGLESVNPGIRKTMRKEVPLESYAVANRLTNKYGIETLNSCMIGLPGETVETIRETMAFLRRSREIKQANLSIAVPYPGTELYALAKRGEEGLQLLDEDFSHFRRYGSAVMRVGDLCPADLVALQNDAFVSIYLAPWRIAPMVRKSGWISLFLVFLRLLRSLAGAIFDRSRPSLFRRGGGKKAA